MKANVFCSDGKIRFCRIGFESTVTELEPLAEGPVSSAKELLIPGLVDIHSHGAMGYDTCDASPEGLKEMSLYYAQRGVTSFLATTMSYREERLAGIMKNVADHREVLEGAKCLGINMEGPYISKSKKGAQSGKDICAPDIDMFRRLYKLSGKCIRLVDIAPERDEGLRFTKEISRICHVSVAHTEADYDMAVNAFEAGADHVTHLFNAMPSFNHRNPGVVGAAADKGAYVELICDGYHIHPSVVRNIYKMFALDKVCLISDSMRSAGLPDGKYELGGQAVYVRIGKATLEDGTLAGSSIHLMDALQNVIKWGVNMETAIRSATMNPAASVGRSDIAGSLRVGAPADIVVLDENFNIKEVRVRGKVVG